MAQNDVENRMPLYALDDWRPELPPEGEYWIAPNASLIGRVRLGCVQPAPQEQ